MTSFSETIQADLIRDEGWRTTPYKDSKGLLTLGVGHNLVAEGLCREAILAQLDYDLRTKAIEPLDLHLPWWKDHPDLVRRVLINLAFNLGIGNLLKFKATLTAIQANQYPDAANHLRNSLYAKQVGARAERLAKLLESVV